MRRIAFFGGTFDPPHRGHLAIAKAAADIFALDQVLFAPVAHQPLKENHVITPFLHRYAMTVLATEVDARFVPSLLDAPREYGAAHRPNYTVGTLERLRSSLAALPEPTALFTLVGADSWLEIARWHDAPRLLTLTDWIIAARPGFSMANAERALPPGVSAQQVQESPESFLRLRHSDGSTTQAFFLPHMQEDISATELRGRLAGHVDEELLSPAMQEYIRKTGLYRPN